MGKKNNDHESHQEQDVQTNSSLSQREKRSLIFHLLYAAESYDYSIELMPLIENLNKGFNVAIPLQGDIATTAAAIIEHREELDQHYKPFLTNWRFDRLGLCTKLILRYALWELFYTTTTPTIVINEAIELAKCYAEKDAYKFINGILDEILKSKNNKE